MRHICGIRHPSANVKGRFCFLDMVLAKFAVRMRGIALPGVYFFLINNSEREQNQS